MGDDMDSSLRFFAQKLTRCMLEQQGSVQEVGSGQEVKEIRYFFRVWDDIDTLNLTQIA